MGGRDKKGKRVEMKRKGKEKKETRKEGRMSARRGLKCERDREKGKGRLREERGNTKRKGEREETNKT